MGGPGNLRRGHEDQQCSQERREGVRSHVSEDTAVAEVAKGVVSCYRWVPSKITTGSRYAATALDGAGNDGIALVGYDGRPGRAGARNRTGVCGRIARQCTRGPR